MYKNIYYDRYTDLIHLWDSKQGYFELVHKPYCYIKSKENTGFKTIFGQSVKKFEDLHLLKGKAVETFENDVFTEIRFLVDHYFDNDELPKNLRILSLDIETAKSKDRGYSSPREAFNPVLSISFLLHGGQKRVLLLDVDGRYKNKNNYDFVEIFTSEIHLLKRFLNYLHEVRPDIITGWNSEGYDIPYLYNRIARVIGGGVENNISPIRKCYYREKAGAVQIGGLSHLDYMLLYKNYTYKNLPSYSLNYVSKYELGESKVEYQGILQELYERDIDEFVRYNIQDTDLIEKLDDKLGFINQNITVAVNSCVPYEFALHSTLYQEGRFLSETKKKNLVVPNKPNITKDYPLIGAFVKESKAGLFDWVYDQDLASLYPFIIVTLNLSPETKVGKIRDFMDVWKEKNKAVQFKINKSIFDPSSKVPDMDKEINIIVDMNDGRSLKMKTMGDLYSFMDKENLTLSGFGIFFSKDKLGIIPEIMLKTYEERSEFKKLRNKYLSEGNKDLADFYENKQMGWKILLNSFYGVMGNPKFRFFDPDLAQSITMTGRYVTQSGMDEVIRTHKKMFDGLPDDLKNKIDSKMKDLFDDPHLTGDTDSVILTAMPILYSKFGHDWRDIDENVLVDFVSKASKKISTIINKRMDIFAKNWLNSDKNYLMFKEEWVAKRGFYVGVKKRYANWIIWKEGVTIPPEDRVPEVKGLDIVRSDFPPHLQDFMRNILEDILQNGERNKDHILQHIVSFKQNMKGDEFDDIEKIAKVVSANNLDKYQSQKHDGRWHKGTPYHLIGAIYYNKFLSVNGLENDYQKISEGDKIAFLYLKPNVYGFDRVAYPIDHGRPEEFHRFLDENVDKIKCVKTLLDNKLQTYFNALDWDRPNENVKNISGFLR